MSASPPPTDPRTGAHAGPEKGAPPSSRTDRHPGPYVATQSPSAAFAETQARQARVDEPAQTSSLGAAKARVMSWVAFITGSDQGESEEVRRLLRPRIMGGLVLALIAEITYLTLYFFTALTTKSTALMLFRLPATLLFAALFAYLWRKRDATLAQLRAIEVAIVLIIAAEFAANDYLTYIDAWTNLSSASDQMVRFLYAYSSLNWISLIVAYAVIIPNTFNRSMIVMGFLAAMPYYVALAAWWAMPEESRRPLVPILLYLTRFMIIGLFTAIYGSFRINTLRKEAFDAKRLGQYQLKERLGEGGMGAVYLAEHRLLKRPCAVKLIRPDQTADPANLARFEREVKAMAGLKHWNTVEVFDYGRTPDGTFYYVMEYIRGLSLHQLVQRYGPQPPARVVAILRQICAALREAHEQSLIHRDLKPSNIMLTRIGRQEEVTKLCDFGLVHGPKFGDDSKLTQKGIILGTPDFMSPEQASGNQECDARSDLYSLGAVGYYLLTARPPFTGPTVMHVIMAHLQEPPKAPSYHRVGIPAELDGLVLKCLTKAPDGRFASCAALDQALASCTSQTWSEADANRWWAEYEEKRLEESGEAKTAVLNNA